MANLAQVMGMLRETAWATWMAALLLEHQKELTKLALAQDSARLQRPERRGRRGVGTAPQSLSARSLATKPVARKYCPRSPA